MIDQSKAAMGVATADAMTSDTTNADQTAAASVEVKSRLTIQVDVSAEAKAAVGDTDAVFIFARASQGPPMPLAVVKLQASDLPATVTLDDTQAMIEGMTLSSFPNLGNR